MCVSVCLCQAGLSLGFDLTKSLAAIEQWVDDIESEAETETDHHHRHHHRCQHEAQPSSSSSSSSFSKTMVDPKKPMASGHDIRASSTHSLADVDAGAAAAVDAAAAHHHHHVLSREKIVSMARKTLALSSAAYVYIIMMKPVSVLSLLPSASLPARC